MINIVYPESHDHLGILNDLQNKDNVVLIPIKSKDVHSGFLKALKRIHLSSTINRYIHLPGKNKWFNIGNFVIDDKSNTIIIFDGALKHYKAKELNEIFKKTNAEGILVLINSMRASSAAISDIRGIIPQVRWKHIYSFDPKDVADYGFEYLGCCYYSMKPEKTIREKYPCNKEWDVYFVGGSKGGRWNFLLSTFELLDKNGLKTCFNINVTGKERIGHKPYTEKINYYSSGWMPYEQILSDILCSNVILEFLQNGQHGPSLRYYEAVCYNKKLITTNKDAKSLPYYNSEYIKIIDTPEDIDISWIMKKENVDYGYKGDFSPAHLLECVLKDD